MHCAACGRSHCARLHADALLPLLVRQACMNPSPGFYRMFNGYTLGLLAAELGMGALWLLGTYFIAPIAMSHLEQAERERRRASFNSTVLSRLLLMLYLVRRRAHCLAGACGPWQLIALLQPRACTRLRPGCAGSPRRFCRHFRSLLLQHVGERRELP